MILFNSYHWELSNKLAFDQYSSLLSVVKIVNSKNRVLATFAARLRSKNASQKSKKLNFLNKTVNFQKLFSLSSKSSFINRYFFMYLLFFKSSSRRCRDITNLYLFICLRQLLKFVEISVTSICVMRFSSELSSQKITKRTILEIRLIKVLALSRKISFVNNLIIF